MSDILISAQGSAEQTAHFFVEAMNQLSPPKFRDEVTDADVWHKAMILADYAWIPRTGVDQAASVLILRQQAELGLSQIRARAAPIIGSACLMVSGFYDNGVTALGYRSKELLIRRGIDAFLFAAALELDAEKQRVLLQTGREFDNWRRYFLRLHRAFRTHRIAPPECLLQPPQIVKPS